MFDLAWLIILLPAAGVLINLFFGPKLGDRRVGYMAPPPSRFSWSPPGTLCVYGAPAETSPHRHPVGLDHRRLVCVAAALLIDPLSLTWPSVTGVSADPRLLRRLRSTTNTTSFFLYLSFFIFAMLILVLSGSFLGMFVGWEGSAGLLRSSAGSTARRQLWLLRRRRQKAFLVNRIGD